MHTTTSSDDVQSSNFSFGIKGNSSYITPNIIPGNSQVILNQEDIVEEYGQMQPQRKEQTTQRYQLPGKELQREKNAHKDAEKGKEIQENHRQVPERTHRKEGNRKEHHMDNNQQGETTSSYQVDRASMEYQNNFPKISKNYTR